MSLKANYSILLFLLTIFFSYSKLNATTYDVNNLSELNTGLSSSSDGDTLAFYANIVVTSSITISKALVLNGNGYTITVPINGINDNGLFNSSPSSFRVFEISASGKTITINSLNIKGGSTSTSGGAVNISSGTTTHFNHCTISNSKGPSSGGGGGGINNAGTCYLTNSKITRNGGGYGGGFINSGTMFIENSEITENRSLCSNCGGGGGTNIGSSSALYVNNSTFANNNSSELGGGFNNYQGKAYFLNTTFSGNVTYSNTYKGGAIAQNSSHPLYLISCAFGYNYRKNNSNSPFTFDLDDVHSYSGVVNMYYSIYFVNSTTSGSINYTIGNEAHLLAADGSDNDIFTGGIYTKVFDENGIEFGTAKVFRPYLVNIGNQKTPTLQTGSYLLTKGCNTGFSTGASPVIGYKNMGTNTWVDILGTGASGFEVTTDELGDTRPSPPTSGALEKIVDNYSILAVTAASNGSVSGASIYGDVYPNGTSVSLLGLPDNGYVLTDWTYVEGGSGNVSGNPLSLVLNANTTLTPNFSSSTNNTITYIGNGNTSGSSPAVETYTSGATATISNNVGNLAKTGFTFDGWNTTDNGSGTDYSEGSTTTINTNMVLYAVWSSTGSILPIDLIDFSATPLDNKTVNINWSTSSELNNSHFEVLRSMDGENWDHISRVNGQGNSDIINTYNVRDNDPIIGISYYKLKQVDFDGTFTFSKIEVVEVEKLAQEPIHIFPNPAFQYINIEKENIVLENIQIFNIQGQLITPHIDISKVGDHLVRIDFNFIENGVYYIKYNDQVKSFILF